ncbi:MAG: hypothetical protein HC902_13855, partial [Calothrix sp. SM1_5_4]|nr:hypothetical protein [Calothrix sp. SM1_5_4]
MGVILEDVTADEVENLLDRHPDARVRVLNGEHGLYEIFGVTKQTVREETGG